MFIDVSELGSVENIEIDGGVFHPSQVNFVMNFNKVSTIGKCTDGDVIGFLIGNSKIIYKFTSIQEAEKVKKELLERLNK